MEQGEFWFPEKNSGKYEGTYDSNARVITLVDENGIPEAEKAQDDAEMLRVKGEVESGKIEFENCLVKSVRENSQGVNVRLQISG